MREQTTLEARIPAPWELAGVERNTPVLLALSGGADSRLLLHLLVLQSRRDGFLLVAAHVDHGIRGEEAERDRLFCEQICREYGVTLCVLSANVPSLARAHGRGLEEEAREVRYAYFASLMRERSIPLLVTAHNADDHAETVLFRLARGTGAAGLCGIAPVRAFAGGYLVRPMLALSKREILDLCREEELAFVTDSTNADVAYSRNRLRAEVLPVLEDLFAGATHRIGEVSRQLREEHELLESLAEPHVNRFLERGGCPIGELSSLHPALRRIVLTQWLQRTAGVSPERVHTEALMRLMDRAVPHSRMALPGGVEAVIESGELCIAEPALKPMDAYQLPFSEGEITTPDGKWTISVQKGNKNLKVHNLSTAPCIILAEDSAIMKGVPYWRSRREGDRILLRGMHRSVRRLMREAGIPLSDRTRLPMLCTDEEILWVPYVGARDGIAEERDGNGILVRIFDHE